MNFGYLVLNWQFWLGCPVMAGWFVTVLSDDDAECDAGTRPAKRHCVLDVVALSDADDDGVAAQKKPIRATRKCGRAGAGTSDSLVAMPQLLPLPAVGRKRPFIEVFAGSRRLTDTFAAVGHMTFAMDVKYDPLHDITTAGAANMLRAKVLQFEASSGMKPYLHFAPPCCTYTRCRYPSIRSSEYPHGLPPSQLSMKDKTVLKLANRITEHAFALMMEHSMAGCWVSLEQPHTSLLLKERCFLRWAARTGVAPTILDYCQFGMPYRKRTVLWGPTGVLTDLGRRCPGLSDTHSHPQTLSNWGEKSKNLDTALGSSEYPQTLCEEWVRVVNSAQI